MQLEEREQAAIEEPPKDANVWLRNVWYAAAWSADLSSGRILARTILGEPLVLARLPDASVIALADYCPHRFAPLHLGKLLENGHLQCGYHGLEFDRSGRCVLNPHGNGNIPPQAVVPSYPICERYGVAWIWMGDAPADESTIADYKMFENVPALYSMKQDYLQVAAPYELLQDNLMDASHVAYVHVGTISSGEIDDATTELVQNGDQVAITRRSKNAHVTALVDALYRSNGGRVDKWNTIRWDPPASILVYTGATECGADDSSGTGYFGMHLLTPETESTAHYHFWAVRWNPRDPDEASAREVLERLNVARRRAFEAQDAPIIEAQNRVRRRLGPDYREALLSVDAAAVRVRKVSQRLRGQEAGEQR